MAKEHPIPMSAPMVVALLDDRKRMTRKVITKRNSAWEVGDTLWVQETWRPYSENEVTIQYRADNKIIAYPEKEKGLYYGCGQAWRSSGSMPRWASRITREITAIRAERLQDITEEDAIAEGLPARSETGYVWTYEFKKA